MDPKVGQKKGHLLVVGGIENEGESMPRTPKSHPPNVKAKVALEAIKVLKQIFG